MEVFEKLGVRHFAIEQTDLEREDKANMELKTLHPVSNLLGQWLNFKLFGITCLVGKNKVQTFFFRVHWLSEPNMELKTLHPVSNRSIVN